MWNSVDEAKEKQKKVNDVPIFGKCFVKLSTIVKISTLDATINSCVKCFYDNIDDVLRIILIFFRTIDNMVI